MMVRFKAIGGTVGILAAATIGGAQAYYVRELTPGWPPQFHANAGPVTTEMVEIPLERLQHVGVVLVLAILCLAGVALGRSGKGK